MPIREKTFFFFLYPPKFLAEAPVAKDRLTREKHLNVFNISFMGHGEEVRIWRHCYPWVFLCKISWRGRVMGKWRVRVQCNKLGEPARSIPVLLCVALSSKTRMVFSSGNREGTSHMKGYNLFRGKVESPSSTDCFSDSFILNYLRFGIACLEFNIFG